MRLVATGYPPRASILLLGSPSAEGPSELLHRFREPTVLQEQLGFARKAWRGVRYLRLVLPASPSASDGWVTWGEIAVYGPTKPVSQPRRA